MIEEPGSFSGMVEFADAATRPGGEPAHIVGDLHQRSGQGLQRAMRVDQRVVSGQGFELVGRGHERQVGEFRELLRHPHRVFGMGVQARAYRGAAEREFGQMRDRGSTCRMP
jgi:hypothetical protein